jgi:hypothetical protein
MCSSMWLWPFLLCKSAAARQFRARKWLIPINQKVKRAFPSTKVSFFHETVSFEPEKRVIGARNTPDECIPSGAPLAGPGLNMPAFLRRRITDPVQDATRHIPRPPFPGQRPACAPANPPLLECSSPPNPGRVSAYSGQSETETGVSSGNGVIFSRNSVIWAGKTGTRRRKQPPLTSPLPGPLAIPSRMGQ